MSSIIKRLVLSDNIDDDSVEDITRAIYKIQDERGEKPCDRIELHIQSGGGSIPAGLALYNVMVMSDIRIDTVVIGMCASMAVPILQAGKQRSMYSTGTCVMIHPARTGVGYNRVPEAAQHVAYSTTVEEEAHKLVRERVGMTAAAYRKLMGDARFMLSKEALERNFVDRIIKVPKPY